MTTRPYRPSNSTEGIDFDDRWCSRCQRDAAWREDAEQRPCEILSRAQLYDIGDPEYPAEWIEDDVPNPQQSNPRCSAFVLNDADAEIEAARADPRQMKLPL